MLKFIVKYTNHELSGPWLKKFLGRPLPAQARELRIIFDSLRLTQEMERYWSNLQKQRYSQHFRWFHCLDLDNTTIWTRKQLYKLRWPNRYLRQKALWRFVSLGGEIPENPCKMWATDLPLTDYTEPVIIGPLFVRHTATSSSTIPSQEKVASTITDSNLSLNASFSEWVKTSSANLSITISYAWNELKEDGILQKDIMQLTPVEAELMTSLRDLEGNINCFGSNSVVGQGAALEYAKVVLRFTQALHDYLEEKDRKSHEDERIAFVSDGMIIPHVQSLKPDEMKEMSATGVQQPIKLDEVSVTNFRPSSSRKDEQLTGK